MCQDPSGHPESIFEVQKLQEQRIEVKMNLQKYQNRIRKSWVPALTRTPLNGSDGVAALVRRGSPAARARCGSRASAWSRECLSTCVRFPEGTASTGLANSGDKQFKCFGACLGPKRQIDGLSRCHGWIGAVEKRPVEVSRAPADVWEPFFEHFGNF